MKTLIEINKKIEKAITRSYQKIEDTTVLCYRHIEGIIVSYYKKIETSFVDAFFDTLLEEEVIDSDN